MVRLSAWLGWTIYDKCWIDTYLRFVDTIVAIDEIGLTRNNRQLGRLRYTSGPLNEEL